MDSQFDNRNNQLEIVSSNNELQEQVINPISYQDLLEQNQMLKEQLNRLTSELVFTRQNADWTVFVVPTFSEKERELFFDELNNRRIIFKNNGAMSKTFYGTVKVRMFDRQRFLNCAEDFFNLSSLTEQRKG